MRIYPTVISITFCPSSSDMAFEWQNGDGDTGMARSPNASYAAGLRAYAEKLEKKSGDHVSVAALLRLEAQRIEKLG